MLVEALMNFRKYNAKIQNTKKQQLITFFTIIHVFLFVVMTNLQGRPFLISNNKLKQIGCYLVFLATARIFGCSTAVCESTFSVLTGINRPARSMTHQRLANLVFLAFEKYRTNSLDFDRFLRKFNSVKNRRFQLF